MFASPDWDSDVHSATDINPLNNYWMEGDSLAPPIHTAMDVVANMLQLAEPSSSDYLVDLGCGDGRIPIEAVLKYECQSTGIELESRLTEIFAERVASLNLGEYVKIVNSDITDEEELLRVLENVTIVTVYLLPDAVEKIRPVLESAIKRSNRMRFVFNTWSPKSWKPIKSISCGFSNNSNLFLFDSTSVTIEKG